MPDEASWHSGFSVDTSVTVWPQDTEGLERLCRYLLRCPLSLSRIHWTPGAKTLFYEAKGSHDDPLRFSSARRDPPWESTTGCSWKTILNRVQKHRSFVYETVRFVGEHIEVELRPRQNSQAICSECQRPAPGYDRLEQRCYEFVPLWNLKVFFLYAPRRVECRRCGVKVEQLPWSEGKQRRTRAYAWFLASWAKRMSWKEVAELFHTSWESVFGSVEMAVYRRR